MPASVNDLFGQLLEFSWRGIPFPVVEFTTDMRQGQAVHKFADRDGAHVEATGREPLEITARIPFLNGLQTAANETWAQPLYPTQWRAFFAACADKTSGPLQHPELGTLTCKCQVAKMKWAGNVRTGIFVDASWIESDDTQADLTEALTGPSPIANLTTSCSDLDSLLPALNPALPPVNPFQPPTGFGALLSAVRSSVDQFTIAEKQFAGRLANIIYQAQALENSLQFAQNATCFNWPLFQACEAAKSAAYDTQTSLLNKQSKTIAYYKVQKDSTIGQLAAALAQPVVDLMMLNSGIIGLQCIPQDFIVRYYTASPATQGGAGGLQPFSGQ
jgi:DNA circularisation protein